MRISNETAARRAGLLASFPARFRRRVSQGEYNAEIDGLRFFAIAFVIFGHTLERAIRFFPDFAAAVSASRFEPFLQLAPPGVFLFFAISGYVIATQSLKSSAPPLSLRFLKSYFGRRILRIEPPYILLLVATYAFMSLTHWSPEGVRRFDVEPHSLTLSLFGSVFYLHDLVWGSFPRLFPPGWSLEVEVQFYLLAPVLFALWATLGALWERAALTLMALAIGVNLSLLGLKTLGPVSVEYSLLHYFNYFWLGIALAHARAGIASALARLPAVFATTLGWAGLAAFVATATPGEQAATAFEAARLFAVYASLAAIFASTFDPRSGFRRFCSWPWISLIGGACYSIYLVHLQIIQVAFIVAAKIAPHPAFAGIAALFALSALAVIAVGLAYYVQVERRFMARDWPQAALARLRGASGRGVEPGLHLVIDKAAPEGAAASRDARAALKRRSAAARP